MDYSDIQNIKLVIILVLALLTYRKINVIRRENELEPERKYIKNIASFVYEKE